MAPKKEEELEFITVHGDDDDDGNMTQQVLSDSTSDSVIGNWFFKQSKHPTTVFFHLFFKASALFLYIFGSWFTTSFIFTFVICVILLAFDFWVVKNVSGRLLVGLRWWSYVKEDGSNEWIFESLEDMAEISAVDSRFFWGALYASPAVWSLLLVLGLVRLKFEYLPIVLAALSMNFANIIGYVKCSSSASSKIQNMAEAGMKQASMSALENSSVRNWVFSTLLAVSNNAGVTSSTAQGTSTKKASTITI